MVIIATTRSFAHSLFILAITGIALISGCSEDATPPPASAEIDIPPSMQVVNEVTTQIINLDDTQAEDLNIQTVPAVRSEDRFALTMPGTVFPAPDNIAIVSAPITGRVNRIMAHEGEPVRRGEVLLELESLEFASLVADYLQAKADETYTKQQVSRLEQLVEKKISPQSALEKARAELLRSDASVRAVYAQLKLLGVTDAQLEAWQGGEISRPLLSIRAPISGVINDHLIDLGQSVPAYEEMLNIINLDQVLIRGYLSPEDAGLVRPNDPVTVSLQDYPSRKIEAAVMTINPALSEANKSVMVNIISSTSDGWPLPGQNVQLKVMVAPPAPVLSIPLSAVEYEGDRATVFVRKSANAFEKRVVTISRLNEDQAIISDGLEANEEVAITQVFSLKALGRFELYGEE